MCGIVTLTTDFGLRDEYVGVMKGVILGRFPDCRLVDLSHEIEPQNVRQAAYMLEAACGYLPAGTVHLAVVDPGVGTDRRIIAVRARGQIFVAPDNGLLSLITADTACEARLVACEDLYIKPVSSTFHGRDIMAPVAAHLAAGLPLERVGPLLASRELVGLTLPRVVADRHAGTLSGTVIDVDRFGNLLTDISYRRWHDFAQGSPAATITVAGRIVGGLRQSYAQVEPGALIALFGSRNRLEIAVRDGSAATVLGSGRGAEVTITLH